MRLCLVVGYSAIEFSLFSASVSTVRSSFCVVLIPKNELPWPMIDCPELEPFVKRVYKLLCRLTFSSKF